PTNYRANRNASYLIYRCEMNLYLVATVRLAGTDQIGGSPSSIHFRPACGLTNMSQHRSGFTLDNQQNCRLYRALISISADKISRQILCPLTVPKLRRYYHWR